MSSRLRSSLRFLERPAMLARRFSSTVSVLKILRRSGTSPMPSPAMACRVVVLPAPFVPMMPVIEPRRTLREMPRTAVTTRSYVTSRFCTSSSTSSERACARGVSCAVAVIISLAPVEIELSSQWPVTDVGDDALDQTRDPSWNEDQKDRDQSAVQYELEWHDVVDLRIGRRADQREEARLDIGEDGDDERTEDRADRAAEPADDDHHDVDDSELNRVR